MRPGRAAAVRRPCAAGSRDSRASGPSRAEPLCARTASCPASSEVAEGLSGGQCTGMLRGLSLASRGETLCKVIGASYSQFS